MASFDAELLHNNASKPELRLHVGNLHWCEASARSSDLWSKPADVACMARQHQYAILSYSDYSFDIGLLYSDFESLSKKDQRMMCPRLESGVEHVEKNLEISVDKASIHPTSLYQNVHATNSCSVLANENYPSFKLSVNQERHLQHKVECVNEGVKRESSRNSDQTDEVQNLEISSSVPASSSGKISEEPANVNCKSNVTLQLKKFVESETVFEDRRKSGSRSERVVNFGEKGNINKSQNDKQNQCTVCHANFTSASNLRGHMRVHTGEKPFVCEVCATAFSDRSALRRHRRIHSGSKPYICKECGEAFARAFTLTVHLRRHSGEKPYQCQHCGMSFSQSANLKKHIRIHTGDRPYQCDLCSASFAQGNALKCHYTTHKKEKPFMCQECGDVFSRSQYLQKHMKTHDHSKSYLCQFCSATFRTQESLRYHTESHVGDKVYQCEECMITFYRKDHYKVHKFRTHRNVKYSCDLCDAVYNRSDHLKRHKGKNHVL